MKNAYTNCLWIIAIVFFMTAGCQKDITPSKLDIWRALQAETESCIHFLENRHWLIPASNKTQDIIWQAEWNADMTEITSLKDGENTYTFENAISVAFKQLQILISDEDLAGSDNKDYFRVLYFKKQSNSRNQTKIRADIHIVPASVFQSIKTAAQNNQSLNDYPALQVEACYTLTAQKIEETSITVESLQEAGTDNTSDTHQKVETLFQNRQVYLITSHGAWKTSDQITGSTFVNVQLHDSEEEKEPLNILSKKESNPDSPESTTNLQLITPMTEVLEGTEISANSAINSEHLGSITLQPFEMIFDFEVETTNFTVNITTDQAQTETLESN